MEIMCMMREGCIRLESTGNVVGVLVAAVFLDVASVELLIEDFFGVLLGLVGCVWVVVSGYFWTVMVGRRVCTWVVEVSLVATNDVAWVGHVCFVGEIGLGI